jgi:hypothetical protein
MSFEPFEARRRLRERLEQALVAVGRSSVAERGRPSELGPVDLLVTRCEVNDRHGTGVLLRRIFGPGGGVVTVRSHDFYGGEQAFGAARVKLAHAEATRGSIYASLLATIGRLEVRRILCIPYDQDEIRTALAAQDLFGAPLCTWVMDDQNIEDVGIPDASLRELFARSTLRLAISSELQLAYRRKFGVSFGLAPPAVDPLYLQLKPTPADPARLAARRGLVFGNIWGEAWFDGLLDALDGAAIEVDWHHGGGTPWRALDPARLARSGITNRPFLPEQELVAALRASPFVLVPSGTLEGDDPHRFIARLSLPSRLVYVVAAAGTPVVVLGHPDTAAARFVIRHGLGLVVPYRRAELARAVAALCTPEAQARHRAAASALAPALSAQGMERWLWRSLEAGQPIDDRFATLELSE